MSARLCHDMTHPLRDRAPHCTQVASPVNIIEAPPGEDDLYFCDACFKVGNDILKQLVGLAQDSDATIGDIMDIYVSHFSSVHFSDPPLFFFNPWIKTIDIKLSHQSVYRTRRHLYS